jgi:hypothetical protein
VHPKTPIVPSSTTTASSGITCCRFTASPTSATYLQNASSALSSWRGSSSCPHATSKCKSG